MNKEILTKEELFVAIDDTVAQLGQLLSSLDINTINKIPYANSWTPGQLIRHVTKSTNGMAQAMQAPAQPAERDPAQNVHHLKNTFLNFLTKMNSPEFIIPEDEEYNTKASLTELEQSFKKLKESAGQADLNGLVKDLPFGPTTKLELLHFILFHTERHLHQMRRICDALK